MASAVDKQPAAARLATVAAAAGCLPKATNESQTSYTTCGDTTGVRRSPTGSRPHTYVIAEPARQGGDDGA